MKAGQSGDGRRAPAASQAGRAISTAWNDAQAGHPGRQQGQGRRWLQAGSNPQGIPPSNLALPKGFAGGGVPQPDAPAVVACSRTSGKPVKGGGSNPLLLELMRVRGICMGMAAGTPPTRGDNGCIRAPGHHQHPAGVPLAGVLRGLQAQVGPQQSCGWTDRWWQQQRHLTTLQPAASPAASQYSNCGSSKGNCTSLRRLLPAHPPTHPPTWVLRSQNLTVVSPLPLARRRPSGLKFTDSTASAAGSSRVRRSAGACGSVGALGRPSNADSSIASCRGNSNGRGAAPACPGMLAVHRVTARTLNTACGWYTTRSTDSTDTCRTGTEGELDELDTIGYHKKDRGAAALPAKGAAERASREGCSSKGNSSRAGCWAPFSPSPLHAPCA